jgi:hypothetical protein
LTTNSVPFIFSVRDPKSPLASFIPSFLATMDFKPKSITDYGRLLKEFDAFTGHIDYDSALTIGPRTRLAA